MPSPKRLRPTPDPRKGFTLIELLVGAGLAVMLLGVMIPVALKTVSIVEKAQDLSQHLDWMTGALYQIKSCRL